MEKKEGKVKDLVEELQRGEITSKEALKKLEERRLTEGTVGGSWESTLGFIPWVIHFILWLLPTWARYFKLDFLEWFAQLRTITIPSVAIYISIVFIVVGTFFLVWGILSHRKKGGLKKTGEAIILYKEGPYSFMRHPQVAGGIMWPFLLPIILSEFVSFTVLSIAAIVIMIIYFYYGTHMEEKLSIEKWGDEYQQYMKEVPGFNFILGLWRLRKRRKC